MTSTIYRSRDQPKTFPLAVETIERKIMKTVDAIEFCFGSHIREAILTSTERAKSGPIEFDWNGEHYEFPQEATAEQIQQEYESRTGSRILSAENERIQHEERMRKTKEEDEKRNGHLIIEDGSLDKAPEECSTALELWDSGEYVVTVSMGGLGPGYEVCIQCLAFELVREFKDDSIPKNEELRDKWFKESAKPRKDSIISKLDKRFGFSGAQCGAASNLAFCVLRRGYRNALSELSADRLIRARKPPEDHRLWN